MGGSRLILFLSLAVMAGFAYFIIQGTNNEIMNLHSGASSNSSFETETGVLAGAVNTVNDTTASGGKSVLLNNTTTSPWTLLGTHPFASTQASDYGKILRTLQPFSGRIYIGYGDSGANTGPIHIMYYDTTQNTFTDSFLLTTEEVDVLNPINGKLYGLVNDRKGGSASYAVGEPWSAPTFTGADSEHNYDIKTYTGSDLWLSTSYAACRIWRSMDSGLTWTNSFTVAFTTGKIGSAAARCSFLGVYNGNLYTQAHDRSNTSSYAHTSSNVYNGSKWANGPDLLPNKTRDTGYKANTFAGKMIYRSNYNYNSDLYAFNGSTVSKPYTKLVYDYAIDGTTLYVLAADATIASTTNLTIWTTISTAPSTARSITVLNGKIYIGTSDSMLYRLD